MCKQQGKQAATQGRCETQWSLLLTDKPRACLLDTSLSASPHPTSFDFYNLEEKNRKGSIFFNVFQHSGLACALEVDKVVGLPQKMILTWASTLGSPTCLRRGWLLWSYAISSQARTDSCSSHYIWYSNPKFFLKKDSKILESIRGKEGSSRT